jgi:hypothetical protein
VIPSLSPRIEGHHTVGRQRGFPGILQNKVEPMFTEERGLEGATPDESVMFPVLATICSFRPTSI